MTEEKFTDLVNLYLDKEISESELSELKAELTQSPDRRVEFRERCQLHQAMRMALSPNARAQADSRACILESDSKSVFPQWKLLGGLAAILVLSFVFITPALQNLSHVVTQPIPVALGDDPVDRLGKAEFQRFAATQENIAEERSSIVAKHRLMGLSPDLTPNEKQLREVSLASARRPEAKSNHAELLEKMQEIRPIPTPRILRAESSYAEPAVRWPVGFQTSLASFK